jgi:hypothetical protein
MNTQSIQLPVHRAPERATLVRRARLLAWGGVAWHGLEMAVALGTGIVAGSIALIGFGADSLIEALAGGIVQWRFAATRASSEAAERRAQQLIGLSLYLLAAYVGVEALRASERWSLHNRGRRPSRDRSPLPCCGRARHTVRGCCRRARRCWRPRRGGAQCKRSWWSAGCVRRRSCRMGRVSAIAIRGGASIRGLTGEGAGGRNTSVGHACSSIQTAWSTTGLEAHSSHSGSSPSAARLQRSRYPKGSHDLARGAEGGPA